MQGLDWLVLGGYLLAMLVLAGFVGRRQSNSNDYFLGGRRLSAKALATSTLATQCSTNSLLGAPAFVGFSLGGGLIWLQYELAVPLAMLVLAWILVPARRLGVTSIYAILELRLGRSSRLTAAACFMFFRAIATAVTIYGSALVVSVILNIGFLPAVCLLMGVTLVYDLLGGLAAVVYSDVIQLILLVGAVVFSLFFIGDLISWEFFASGRNQTLVNDWGLHGQDYGFWPMLIGGLFLYAAYYGCDQSQAQRILAASSEAETRKVLLLNGLLRFPLVLCYCLLGLGLATLASLDGGWLQQLPETADGNANLNLVFPVFVLEYYAPGFVGLIMVGLIAAAMSSIDSALNSLAAVTLEDFVKPHLQEQASPQRLLNYGRLCTLFWAVLTIAFSFQVESIAPTVLEAVNKIGSMVNGPLLALVGLAILTKGLPAQLPLVAFGLGLAANFAVAIGLPDVSWLWWNVIGFVITVAAALLGAPFYPRDIDAAGPSSLESDDQAGTSLAASGIGPATHVMARGWEVDAPTDSTTRGFTGALLVMALGILLVCFILGAL
ncbi:MAG TPA: sodium:solute symporter [Gammaproteobacteria bacterium]|nr:sodium:solute symporter [Gammaproteobacteria bacterium]